jgi:hypothetical protein
METTRSPRGVPAAPASGGDGGSITRHHKDELDMSGTPELPEDGERAYVRFGLRPAIVFRHDRKGTPIYYVHHSRRCRRMTETQIRDCWGDAEAWSPNEAEEAHIRQADDGQRTYVDALQDIEAVYHVPEHDLVGGSTEPHANREMPETHQAADPGREVVG